MTDIQSSPTLIAARYPLCLRDETLVNDDQLIRYIGERCGEDVANVICDLIYENSIRARIADALEEMDSAISDLETTKYEIESAPAGLKWMVEDHV